MNPPFALPQRLNGCPRAQSLRAALLAALYAAVLTMAPAAGAQTGNWAWLSGSNVANEPADAFGTLGVAAPGNFPGGRDNPVTWTDDSGNLWLFGGSGGASQGIPSIHFNDLWEFNPQTSEWTWMGGSDTGAAAVYGTMGVPAAGNIPGSRVAAVGWRDADGNLWLFGGWGYDSANTLGMLNDLWKFTPATRQWTWMGGNKTLPNANDGCSPGVYGTQGTASSSNIPGGRQLALAWTGASGDFWLFGGGGCDSNDNQGLLNDLWKFDPTALAWTWMGGSATGYPSGIYGTLGVPAAGNVPGSRWQAATWTGSDGSLWLFGGNGIDSAGNRGYLNDLWKFDIEAAQWTWVGGSSSLGSENCYQPGEECAPTSVYGTLGQPAPGNVPGGRDGSVASVDSHGNLWLFGGANDAGSLTNLLNDLWEFNPQTRQWAWMGGSDSMTCGAKDSQGACVLYGEDGVYGTLGAPAAANVPGSRIGQVSWTDNSGDLWMFGGDGLDSAGNLFLLNDLWEFEVKITPTVAVAASPNPVFAMNSVAISAAVAATGGAPGGTVTFLDGQTSLGVVSLSSGKATLSLSTLAIGSHTITASYAGDANDFPAVSAPVTLLVEDFALAAGTTTAATVKAGGSATFSFTVSPVAPATALPAGVSLSATGGPSGSTYTFSPVSVAEGAGSTAVSLTLAVPASDASAVQSVAKTRGRRPGSQGSPWALALVLLPFAGLLRKGRRRWPLLALTISAGLAALTGLSGCGGGSSPVLTEPISYVITITGAAGALNHSTTVTLTVQ